MVFTPYSEPVEDSGKLLQYPLGVCTRVSVLCALSVPDAILVLSQATLVGTQHDLGVRAIVPI